MNERRITELWNKAVAEIGDSTYPEIITRFAEFVALDEREACAETVIARAAKVGHRALPVSVGEACACAIRMRSNATGQARPQGVACTDGLGDAVPPAPTFERD